MTFQPNPGDEIIINGTAYTVGQHPAAPGLAYAQAGRQGIVYQLLPVNGELHEAKALKVFFPKFRIPAMVYQSEHMANYREIPGLQVCSRDVLTPERNGDLIADYPDLLYAVIMPWIHGITWFDVISDQRTLGRGEALMLAKALAAIGSSMEQRGLAHCDLSAPNVMLPFFSEVKLPEGSAAVELVDVEQIYSPKMDRPDVLLAGSPGYAAHRTVHSGLWSAYADRFAGAIIIAEMLGWSDQTVVGKSWGESYFDQHEMQTPCERYFLLKKSLGQRWGAGISDLFTRAWDSQDLSSCPTFGEWLVALSAVSEEEVVEETAEDAVAAASSADEEDGKQSSEPGDASVLDHESLGIIPGNGEVNDDVVDRLFHQARDLENAGNLQGALEIFRSAYHFVKKDSPLEVELASAIQGLEQQLNLPDPGDQGWRALIRSRKFMLSAAAAVVILAGSAFTVNSILADKAESKQKEAQLAAAREAEEAEAERKQREAEKQKAEEARRQEEEAKKEAERKKAEAALAAEKEKKSKQAAEKAKFQEKYDKQAKYEAYLAQLEEKKKKKLLQEENDKQAKTEANVAEAEAEKKKRQADAEAAAAARTAAEKAAAANKEKARKAQAQAKAKAEKAERLKKQRSQAVVELIAMYNRAYNAQVAGNKDRAENYAREFVSMYQKDAGYYNTVGSMQARLNNAKHFINDNNFWMPKL
ncbi:serine/threonine protein kinase [Paenibacillus faecalis]|uniref:serine/threonine protein kinase n=1 Tax=Paenibacillus faecalis TaxID=2079532 RepID=UPI000D100984|nr:serine/threonine protein kinase [Paenibacillus faecalis]